VNAQQKNLVTALAATLVACGLGLYAYFGVMAPEQEETRRKEVEEKVFAVQAPAASGTDGGTAAAPVFTWLSIELHPAKTVMELQENTWRITSPVSARANKQEVDSLIRELAEAKFKSTLEENPTDADLERYGLKQPQATVTARASVPGEPARQHSLTVHLGIENTFDGSVYLRREGDPRVYTAHGALRFAMLKDTNGWRDPMLFPVEERSLLSMSVKARKNTFTVERTTTEKPWQLVQPMALRVEPERMTQLLSTLKVYQVLSFPSPQEEGKIRQALEKPLVDATFVRKIGGPLRVRMAQLEQDGAKRTYALSEWDSEVVLGQVDNIILNVLDLAPQEFKDKKALAFTVGDVAQIVIRPLSGGEPIKLHQAPDTGRWEVVTPMAGIARQFKVASLLGSLEKFKAASIGESRPKSWGRYGISDTSPGVSLQDAEGKEVARLSLGTAVKGNPQRLWARGSSEDVLEVEKSTYEALPLALTDLMDGAPAAAGTP
jgi:hypothetical protein